MMTCCRRVAAATARTATRSRVAAVRQRACSSRASSSTAAEQEVLWPIGAGAALICGAVVGAFALRNDRAIQRMHGWVQRIQRSGITSDSVTLPWLARLGLAFGLTSLPAESLKLRQLRQGALPTWGAMLAAHDTEQQQIALGALCALLESDAALIEFWKEAGWFDALVQALPRLVHEASDALQQSEILYDALDLSNAIVSHPSARLRARVVRPPRL